MKKGVVPASTARAAASSWRRTSSPPSTAGIVRGAGVDVYDKEPPVDWALAKHPQRDRHARTSGPRRREAQVNVSVMIARQIGAYLTRGEDRQRREGAERPAGNGAPQRGDARVRCRTVAPRGDTLGMGAGRMSADITDILREWEFDSDNQIRIIQADDGRQVLQVRQPMGIEQYELDGRPDGKKPFGRATGAGGVRGAPGELPQRRTAARRASPSATTTSPRCRAKGLLFYFRYLVLFQIGDFVRTARDTEHNLALFALVERFGDSDDDRKELLQYKPYVVRMNAIARAMISLHKEMKSAAEDILDQRDLRHRGHERDRHPGVPVRAGALAELPQGHAEADPRQEGVSRRRR